jgi:hypothetical protein
MEQVNLLIQKAKTTNDKQLIEYVEALGSILMFTEKKTIPLQKQLENIVTCLEKAKELIHAYGKQKWSAKVIKKRKFSSKKTEQIIEILSKDLQKAFAIIYIIILVQSQKGSV